jgi:predicted RNase H-like nuclease (RuvC/YqgF family)
LILGIDPGAHGAIAVLDEAGDLLEVVDMPSLFEANGRSARNA